MPVDAAATVEMEAFIAVICEAVATASDDCAAASDAVVAASVDDMTAIERSAVVAYAVRLEAIDEAMAACCTESVVVIWSETACNAAPVLAAEATACDSIADRMSAMVVVAASTVRSREDMSNSETVSRRKRNARTSASSPTS